MKKRILKNKIGMTLVEVIIGTAIFAIFSVAAASVLVPVLNTFAYSKEYSDAVVLAGNLGERIVNDISLATKIDASGLPLELKFEKLGGEVPSYAVNSEGFLTNNGSLVFPKEYYKGYKAQMSFAQNGKVIEIQVKIEGKTAYEKTMYAKPIK